MYRDATLAGEAMDQIRCPISVQQVFRLPAEASDPVLLVLSCKFGNGPAYLQSMSGPTDALHTNCGYKYALIRY